MRRRSTAKRCLLCLAVCPGSVEEQLSSGQLRVKYEGPRPQMVMAGAVNCDQLQRQLENIFILRKILDLPQSWCEETLGQKGEEEGGELLSGNPANWFAVCGECMESNVAHAWRVYQQILALDVKMMEIKERVKGRMREEMGKPQNRSWTWRQQQQQNELGAGGVEEKIRSFVFPDFEVANLEEEELVDCAPVDCEVEMAVDTNSNCSDDWLDEAEAASPTADPLWDGQDDNDDDKAASRFPPSIPGRRRGRPPKNGIPKSSFTLSTGARRLRGRPFKNGIPKPSFSLSTGKKRPRGRPPKDISLEDILKLTKRKKRRRQGITFGRDDDLENDKRKRWNWFCCHEPGCKAKYTSMEEYQSHEQEHRKREQNGGEKGELDCSQCPFPARDARELELHIENRHLKMNRVFDYSCPQCDFNVQNDFPALKKHYDQEHPDEDQVKTEDPESKPTLSPSELPVTCPNCSRRCENLRYFTVHQRKMHPEQLGIQVGSLECGLCGMKFATQQELGTHVNAEHNRPSKYVCDECGKGYQFLSRLEAHKIVHINKWKRDYVCHLCGLDYAYKYVLEAHYRQCHPSELRGIEGDYSLPTSEDPAASTTTATGQGKEFKCRYCDLSFTVKGILIRHLQQHKQELGHRCDQCGKCYVNDAGLRRHIKINHPLVKEDVPCPYCMKPFASVEYMRDHVNKFCKMKKLGGDPLSTSVVIHPTTSSSTTVTNEDIINDAVMMKRGPTSDFVGGGTGLDLPRDFVHPVHCADDHHVKVDIEEQEHV